MCRSIGKKVVALVCAYLSRKNGFWRMQVPNAHTWVCFCTDYFWAESTHVQQAVHSFLHLVGGHQASLCWKRGLVGLRVRPMALPTLLLMGRMVLVERCSMHTDVVAFLVGAAIPRPRPRHLLPVPTKRSGGGARGCCIVRVLVARASVDAKPETSVTISAHVSPLHGRDHGGVQVAAGHAGQHRHYVVELAVRRPQVVAHHVHVGREGAEGVQLLQLG